ENDDDEYNRSCSLHNVHQRLQCRHERQNKCFSFSIVGDSIKDCEDDTDEIIELEQHNAVHISFQKICDGFVDLLPLAIDGQYETDETNCKYWPCNNIYTRCNKLWNCKDGVDEMSCSHSTGSLNRNQCLFLNDTLNLSCSSINRTNEQKNYFVHRSNDSFEYLYCWNNKMSVPSYMICTSQVECPVENGKPFCSILSTVTNPLCTYLSDAGINYKDRFICYASLSDNAKSQIYFKLCSTLNYHLQITDVHTSNQRQKKRNSRSAEKRSSVIYNSPDAWRCNRGVSIGIRIDSNQTRLYCLCPPSYYGDRCQYANQRVSVTVQIRVTSNWTNIFVFLITLIDNEKNIESYDYIEYLPSRDCHFGPRCHLHQFSCQSQPCLNRGQCIPEDIRYRHPKHNRSMCICRQGYEGDRCEYRQNQTEIDLSFDDLETIPSFLLIHLISVEENAQPKRTSLMKKIQFDEYSTTISTSVSFHMAFAQMSNDYYLIVVRENALIFEQRSAKIISPYRCRSIAELFDEIFSNQHLLKRIKYYHIPCQKHVQLNCFYDDVHICLCTDERQANYFEFDHNMNYDCDGLNLCENQGNCFLDDQACPTTAFCVCPSCFFGSKCQFSTKGSTLSLDIILGYHIRSNVEFNQQQIIVKIATLFIIIIFVF
ncbi:unnamed protein product, partial [Rotaria magnacalcarata]